MDAISLVLDLFAGFVILIIVIAGIAFLRALFKKLFAQYKPNPK